MAASKQLLHKRRRYSLRLRGDVQWNTISCVEDGIAVKSLDILAIAYICVVCERALVGWQHLQSSAYIRASLSPYKYIGALYGLFERDQTSLWLQYV